jgi:hypothetical protein
MSKHSVVIQPGEPTGLSREPLLLELVPAVQSGLSGPQ